MATVAQIKAKLKEILDASGAFGSVYTEDVERIERPQPAAILMWHDGGSQVPQSNRAVTRTTKLLLRLLVPRAAVGGEVTMQKDTDTKLEVLLTVIRQNPTLSTDGVPLVMNCFAESWDIAYNKEEKRMEIEAEVSVEYEEG